MRESTYLASLLLNETYENLVLSEKDFLREGLYSVIVSNPKIYGVIVGA